MSLAGQVTTDSPSAALTEGLRSAFLTATVFAGLGLLAWLIPAKHSAPDDQDRRGEPTV